MRILVCVKAVPGSTEVKMDPKTNTIVRDGGSAVLNPFDASALEVALVDEQVDALGHRVAEEPLALAVHVRAGDPGVALVRAHLAHGAPDGV